MTRFFLSLGSNLGDRAASLAVARARISAEFPGARFSPLYETEPVGRKDQPWFLNQGVEARSDRDPESLLQWARSLEADLGRTRDVPKGPRTLDVDILLCGDRVIDRPSLTLPHPRLLERRFVLVPLFDLDPDLKVPPLGITVSDALRRLSDVPVVRPFSR